MKKSCLNEWAGDQRQAENVLWSNSKLALRAQTLDLLHITNLSPPLLIIGCLNSTMNIGMGFKNSPPAEGWREATGWSPLPIHIHLPHTLKKGCCNWPKTNATALLSSQTI